MSYKSVRPFLRNVSLLNGRIFKVSATINMQERFQFMMGGTESESRFKKAFWQTARVAYDPVSDRCDRAGRGCHVCDIRNLVSS